MLVHRFLENSALCYPEKIALIHEDIRVSYSELNNAANGLGSFLVGNGVEKGNRVVFIIENSFEYVVSYYGILKAGAVAVPLSTDVKPDTLTSILKELGAKCIIFSKKYERLIKALNFNNAESIDSLIVSQPKMAWDHQATPPVFCFEDLVRDKCYPDNFATAVDKYDLASIIYTSGSTGKPKGVMLSHKNVVSNTLSICQYLDLTSTDIQMVVLPFFYVMGKSLLNTHVAVGGTVVLNNRFAFPATVLNQMVEEAVTGFSGVPSTYAYLLHRSPLKQYRDKLVSLRYCSQAGGHMAKKVKTDLRDVLPRHTDIYIMYGATEASARLTYLEPDKYTDKMGSIGREIPGVSIRIMGNKGMALPDGETGELVAAGDNIMQGYWNDDESTNRAIGRHGYRTGDLGYKDKDGFYFVTGRRDSLLKVGGHRVNPQEIEDVLVESGLIIEGVVLGLPDTLLGNKLVAVVTPKDDTVTGNAVSIYSAQYLPKYKRPTDIKFVKALPKHVNGKINREKVVALLQ